MAKRENYNELYLFMQVVRRAVSLQRHIVLDLHNQALVVLSVNLKKGWVYSFWFALRAGCR